MKQYINMTAKERQQDDEQHQLLLEMNKRDAEEEMYWFDQLPVEERRLIADYEY